MNLNFEIEESKYFFLELFIEHALREASCETLTFYLFNCNFRIWFYSWPEFQVDISHQESASNFYLYFLVK